MKRYSRKWIALAGLALSVSWLEAAQYYVAADGTAAGDGSLERPWDLATALKPHKAILPMDTVWVRGGVYKGAFVSKMTGKPNAPVIVRAYPGERVVLDGAGFSPSSVLSVQGSNAWYWGLEVMNSDPERLTGLPGSNTAETRGVGIYIVGPNVKVINCMVHNTGEGVGFWKSSIDSEIYGQVIFNNGWRAPDRVHGPGIYTQNTTGWKHIRDNIILNSYWSGLQLYGSGNTELNNYRLEGNVNFNGRWLVGGGAPAQNIEMVSNLLYKNTAEFFYSNKDNKSLTLSGNYLPVATSAQYWDKVEARDNTFFLPGSTSAPVRFRTSAGSTVKSSLFEGNTFIAGAAGQTIASITDTDTQKTTNYSFATWQSALGFDLGGKLVVHPKGVPPEPKVFVRRNHYEPTRGHVVIYNWPKLDEVEVDIGAMNPQPGDQWELRNVQNYFEEKVQGVYEGKPLKVKMTGWTVANPIGEDKPLNPSTFPEFGVFVLTLQRARAVATVSGGDPANGVAAPGSIVTTLLAGLVTEPVAASGPEYGPELGGVRVELRDCSGREWFAQVLSVGPGGVSYAVPDQFSIGPVAVTIWRGEERLDGGEFMLQASAPALFSANGNGQGAAAGYVTFEGGSISPLADCSAGPCLPVAVGLRGLTVDPVLTLMGTALKSRPASSKVSAMIANAQAEVLGVAPDGGYPGLDLIRLRLPIALAGKGLVPVQVAVDQMTSNAVTVALQ
jgi:uncharacterized protein (TIGR03437 family)